MALRESETITKQRGTKRNRTMSLLADDDESFTNQSKVSLTMAKHLFSNKKYKDNNVVFSPFLLQVVLSIIAAGSDSPTQHQLLDFLQFKSSDDLNSFVSHLLSDILKDATSSGGPCLSMVNGLWVDQSLTLQPSFKEIVSSDYKATLSSVDFETKAIEVTNEVNSWVAKGTNDLIKEILSQGTINNLTRLIFANALYFKGAWDQPFDSYQTKDNYFHLLNGSSVTVPFMTSNEDQFIEVFDDFKVLRLPYMQGEDKRRFSMYIFLPDAKDGLSALVEKVALEFELLEQNLPLTQREVYDFRIPRFKFLFKLKSSEMLKELGVILPFFPGGLTKMVDYHESRNLSISEIYHNSFIQVNEEGTEAAAASVAEFGEGDCDSEEEGIDFIADHPFLFLIREVSTGTILFAGQVLNPLVE